MANVEPNMDCFRLNPATTEVHNLSKYTFLGYFLGWSFRVMGSLGIELSPAFWNRICAGLDYSYTLEDLRSMDVFRWQTL